MDAARAARARNTPVLVLVAAVVLVGLTAALVVITARQEAPVEPVSIAFFSLLLVVEAVVLAAAACACKHRPPPSGPANA
jgi:hypothetical protein